MNYQVSPNRSHPDLKVSNKLFNRIELFPQRSISFHIPTTTIHSGSLNRPYDTVIVVLTGRTSISPEASNSFLLSGGSQHHIPTLTPD